MQFHVRKRSWPIATMMATLAASNPLPAWTHWLPSHSSPKMMRFWFFQLIMSQHCIKTKHHHDTQTHVGYHVTKTLSQYHTTASQHDDPNWLTLLPMALWLPSSANNEDEGFPLSTHPISFHSEQCSNQCTTVMPATASYTNCPLPAMHHHTLLAKTTPALTTDTHLTSPSTSTLTDVSPDVLTAVEAF